MTNWRNNSESIRIETLVNRIVGVSRIAQHYLILWELCGNCVSLLTLSCQILPAGLWTYCPCQYLTNLGQQVHIMPSTSAIIRIMWHMQTDSYVAVANATPTHCIGWQKLMNVLPWAISVLWILEMPSHFPRSLQSSASHVPQLPTLALPTRTRLHLCSLQLS